MLEKNLDSVRCVWTMMEENNGGAMEYEMEIGRDCRCVGISEKEETLILSLSHPPLSFSAPIVVTSSSQISDRTRRIRRMESVIWMRL